jgi:hypothetical protein
MLEPIKDNDNYKPHASLLMLSHKQENVTDEQTVAITISPHRYRGGGG